MNGLQDTHLRCANGFLPRLVEPSFMDVLKGRNYMPTHGALAFRDGRELLCDDGSEPKVVASASSNIGVAMEWNDKSCGLHCTQNYGLCMDIGRTDATLKKSVASDDVLRTNTETAHASVPLSTNFTSILPNNVLLSPVESARFRAERKKENSMDTTDPFRFIDEALLDSEGALDDSDYEEAFSSVQKLSDDFDKKVQTVAQLRGAKKVEKRISVEKEEKLPMETNVNETDKKGTVLKNGFMEKRISVEKEEKLPMETNVNETDKKENVVEDGFMEKRQERIHKLEERALSTLQKLSLPSKEKFLPRKNSNDEDALHSMRNSISQLKKLESKAHEAKDDIENVL
eukprot:g5631.t1